MEVEERAERLRDLLRYCVTVAARGNLTEVSVASLQEVAEDLSADSEAIAAANYLLSIVERKLGLRS